MCENSDEKPGGLRHSALKNESKHCLIEYHLATPPGLNCAVIFRWPFRSDCSCLIWLLLSIVSTDLYRLVPSKNIRMESRDFLFFALRFWPGFQKLWHRGDLHSLLVSLLFSWILVVTWCATFVWTEWFIGFFSPDWLARLILVALWLAIIGASFFSAIGALLGFTNASDLGISARQLNLEIAQELYLQANYFEAEQLVRKNISGQTDDVESSLLWIAILRRTRRIPQALELISSVNQLDLALPWLSELRSEREQCLRIKIQAPPAHD